MRIDSFVTVCAVAAKMGAAAAVDASLRYRAILGLPDCRNSQRCSATASQQTLSISSSCDNLDALVAEIQAATDAIMTNAPTEITDFFDKKITVGTNNQYFTTWDFANGIIRGMSMYTWYPMLLSVEDHNIPLSGTIATLKRLDKPYSNYLRYSGFPRLGEFSRTLLLILDDASRDEVILAVRAYIAYLNRLAAWSFHYFPWSLGEHFPYTPNPTLPPSIPDLNRRIHIKPGVQIKLTWAPLGITVVANLAIHENDVLCTEFINALPFTVIQDHAVVSGESMYAWTPLVSTATVPVLERQCDAPVGRIRYSQGTGNKLVVQHGVVTEDIETPVLGEILPEYIDEVVKVGKAVLKSTFDTKEEILLTVELL